MIHNYQCSLLIKACFVLPDYDLMYKQSIEEPEKFWTVQAKEVLKWDQMFTAVSECVKQEGIVKWFTGGKLNVSSKKT